MPARIARSFVPHSRPKAARSRNRNRHLDAFAVAGRENPEIVKIKQHRLGESLDDGPRAKRKRSEEDDTINGYDEHPSKHARGRDAVKRQFDDDDSVDEGSDSEGNEWTLGGLAEDDDDSDIDSEEAFGDSDEERFEGFTFRGSSSNKSKNAAKRSKHTGRNNARDGDEDIDLEEGQAAGSDEDSDEEDDLGDDAIDLAQALDESEDDIGEEDNSHESADAYFDSEGEHDVGRDDEERIARIQDMAQDYGGGSGEDGGGVSSSKRANASMQLSAADLLDGLEGDWKKQTAAQIKPKKKIAALKQSAPLPKRQQDKLDREAADRKAKEQLDRWQDTVIQNRRAENLIFPLVDAQNSAPTVGKNKFAPLNGQSPQTELEASIAAIMQESGLVSEKPRKENDADVEEAGLLRSEELAVNKLPVEEVLKRRAELRRQRELLFREEIKAKRIKKIKSKAYRRVHRKERERLAEADRAFLGSDDEMDPDERERSDRKRAEARMSAKHKGSKWARTLKATNRTVWDEDARDSVLDQARREEELKRRIAGDDVSDDDENEASSDDHDGTEDEDDNAMLKKIELLREEREGPVNGLASMKFMRSAEARQKAQNDESLLQLRKDFEGKDSEAQGSDVEDTSLGRAIFGPRPEAGPATRKKQRPELEEGSESENERITRSQQNQGLLQPAKDEKRVKGILKMPTSNAVKASGPLAKGTKGVKADSSLNPLPQREDNVSEWLKAEPKTSKRKTKRKGDDEMIPMLSMRQSEPSEEKPIAQTTDVTSSTAHNAEGWQTVPFTKSDDGSDSEPEADGQPMVTPARQKAELFRRAFAGDDVALSFAAEKADAESDEDSKEVSNHLPGWGSWTGEGLSKRLRKQTQRIKHNPLHKTKIPGVAKENRRDKGREDVIISEKKENSGGGKSNVYRAKVLPHGFETKEQWERSLRLPLGPEWTTKETFQRNARPRVVVKPGVVISAMERPLV